MTPRISLFCIILIILLFSCSQPSDMEDLGLLDTEFYSFDLYIDDNAGLAFDVTGQQDGNTIILEYPDYSIPGFQWAPRFSTDAVSVEVEGVEQSSGSSQVNFSNPVTYTLTADSGMIQQFDVELILQPGWQDLGSSPVLAAALAASIRTGFLNNVSPYIVYRNSINDLSAYTLDMVDGITWNPFGIGANNVENFDSQIWNYQIWSVYQTTGPGGNIEAQSCIPPAAWSGPVIATPYTGSAAGLHSFTASSNYLFAAWIDDSSLSKNPVVWAFDGAAWQPLGSSMVEDAYGVSLHAQSFRAVSDGGANVFAACTFGEAEGLIHLFKFDKGSSAWTGVSYESSSSSEDADRIIIDMFYDNEKQAPVIFTRSSNHNYENTFTIQALYYNELAGVWTDLDYIEALYIPESDYTSLDICWFENSPSIAYGTTVLNWDGESWVKIGNDSSPSAPSVQSLSRGVINTYFTAMKDDVTGDLIGRFYQ
ncbi:MULTISPECIES: hypothetical protein [unclassified Oceanispirochaeta]|uniref:hypothetical protein n=1 Tax=unclassified Oceanispirochaeta TaxID=2635722 RepID=UPI000E08E043|nr:MULTISPECIES: hypothetical protein [unclassified Oceanispirochaeta]MBF9017104.1 hypothetical protein [Oceanispirochaeta sp. M2]NPD73553.1 hypothetical protein [Oceanispirochaeta sp. M1]RDG30658.1 hypothetical protein DV872_15765 [Oceanispirochaeta sp. M1]